MNHTLTRMRSFYGFPPEYYEAEYPNKGSPDLAFKVMSLLSSSGIKSKGVTRGLDHGVWSGFHVGAFPNRIYIYYEMVL